MTDIGNRQLAEAIRSGNEQAFEQFFKKYYTTLIKFAYKYVRSVPVAKDIVQDVFLRVWEMRGQIDPDSSLRAYIYNSVRNQALDYTKHEAVKQRNTPELRLIRTTYDRIDEDVLEDRAFIKAAQDAIDALPARAQEVYKLHRSDGLTYKEIAGVMEISVKTVESQMTRALKMLRAALSDYLPVFVLVEVLGSVLP